MDHGDNGILYLDKPNGQTLTPSQLHAWLNQLETGIPRSARQRDYRGRIGEAASSTTAIWAATLPPSANQGRVIITSTNRENWVYASQTGAYFSDQFLTALRQGHNLFNSFWEANAAVTRLNAQYPQEPWLDADGDGVPNEVDDAAIASVRGFGFAGTFSSDSDVRPPHIARPATLQSAQADNKIIRVQVQDNVGVTRVWAVVYAPTYQPPTSRRELVPEDPALVDTIRVVELTKADDTSGPIFAAPYEAFAGTGDYRIIVHAEDGMGLRARPLVYQGTQSRPLDLAQELFLPAIFR